MAVGVNVKLNRNRIKGLTRAAQISLEQTAEAAKTELISKQLMPFDSGASQNESTYVETKNSKYGVVEIITSTPYARRIYYHPEYNFSKVKNANAQGNWWEPFISGKNKDFCKKAFEKLFKRNGGV